MAVSYHCSEPSWILPQVNKKTCLYSSRKLMTGQGPAYYCIFRSGRLRSAVFCSLFSFLKNGISLLKFPKKNMYVLNNVFYQCAKMNMQYLKFYSIFLFDILNFSDLSFLLEPTYKVFHIKNLHACSVRS
jgi:hypothetical protein